MWKGHAKSKISKIDTLWGGCFFLSVFDTRKRRCMNDRQVLKNIFCHVETRSRRKSRSPSSFRVSPPRIFRVVYVQSTPVFRACISTKKKKCRRLLGVFWKGCHGCVGGGSRSILIHRPRIKDLSLSKKITGVVTLKKITSVVTLFDILVFKPIPDRLYRSKGR